MLRGLTSHLALISHVPNHRTENQTGRTDQLGSGPTGNPSNGATGIGRRPRVNAASGNSGGGHETDAPPAYLLNTAPSPAEHFCGFPGCGRSFATANGRGQHERRGHREWKDQQNSQLAPSQGSSRGSQWTYAEDVVLARAELAWEVLPHPPRQVNQHLVAANPALTQFGRTAEAVKKRRQNQQYKNLLRELRETGPDVLAPGQLESAAGGDSDTPDDIGLMGDRVEPAAASMTQNNQEVSRYENWRTRMITSIKDSPLAELFTERSLEEFGLEGEVRMHRHQEYVRTLYLAWVEENLKAYAEDPYDPTLLGKQRRRKGVKSSNRAIKPTPTETNGEPPRQGAKPRDKGSRSRRHRRRNGVSDRRSARTRVRDEARFRAQKAFRQNPHEASKDLIKGKFAVPITTDVGETRASDGPGTEGPPSPEELKAYWGGLFQTESTENTHRIAAGETIWELCEPFGAAEVAKHLKRANETTPGPDGLTLDFLKWGCKLAELTGWFNVFLLVGIPADLLSGTVTLVPKVARPTACKDYRPITVTSRVLRAFHSLLTGRFQEKLALPHEQRGFRKLDGCRDNIWSLQELIRTSTANGTKELSIAFLDVKNAFGSVSHQAIFQACLRKGVPPPVMSHIKRVYQNTSVTFKGDSAKQQFHVRSGVLQGDPLSAELFIHVMDFATSLSIHPTIGVGGDGEGEDAGRVCSYLAYADDMALVARKAVELSLQVGDLEKAMSSLGMLLNAGKCGTMRIACDSHRKRTWTDQNSFLEVNGDLVPALGLKDTYRYLGLQFSPAGITCTASKQLGDGLKNISSAPVDPQQRLFALREVLIPQLAHQLVLGVATGKTLKEFDRSIRQKVRAWTHLPHDTPLGVFHSKVRDGGLGIPCLATEVIRWRADRLKRLYLQASHPLIGWLLKRPDVAKRLERLTAGVRPPGWDHILSTRQDSIDYWKHRLIQSVDNRGLKYASLSKGSYDWVRAPHGLFKGGEFVKALAVRHATLKTRLRASRGRARESQSVRCHLCRDQLHSLSHLSQVCGRTHGMRIARHDAVVTVLEKACLRKRGNRPGLRVIREPIIRTGPTLKDALKPDLIILKGNDAWVIDPTIVSDSADLRKQDEAKRMKYSSPRVSEYLRGIVEHPEQSSSLTVRGLPFSWRGVVHWDSWREIESSLGLPRAVLDLCLLKVLVGTWKLWYFETRLRTR